MSHQHAPLPIPSPLTVESLARYTFQELVTLVMVMQEEEALDLREVHVEPEKPRIGMVVYADGTDWNPGSGVGLYVYQAAGWKLLLSISSGNGAGVAAGTLTNAPSAGNPTKWLTVNDGGTVRYVPSWT